MQEAGIIICSIVPYLSSPQLMMHVAAAIFAQPSEQRLEAGVSSLDVRATWMMQFPVNALQQQISLRWNLLFLRGQARGEHEQLQQRSLAV